MTLPGYVPRPRMGLRRRQRQSGGIASSNLRLSARAGAPLVAIIPGITVIIGMKPSRKPVFTRPISVAQHATCHLITAKTSNEFNVRIGAAFYRQGAKTQRITKFLVGLAGAGIIT